MIFGRYGETGPAALLRFVGGMAIYKVHLETTQCHPESFDKLKIDSAKDLEILRFAPQNDTQKQGFRLDTNLSAAQYYGADPAD